jgi:hypothetical protein
MTIRRIKGASGDLYNPKSKAHRLALNQLADRLREIGFVVECHKDETTLRVYPTKRHQYPLLSPGFESRAEVLAFDGVLESLVFTVWSRGDKSKSGIMPCARGTLDGYLETFNRRGKRVRGGLYFIATGRDYKNLYRHGKFYLYLGFTRANEIDFEDLDKPLRKLWRFLTRLPASDITINASYVAPSGDLYDPKSKAVGKRPPTMKQPVPTKVRFGVVYNTSKSRHELSPAWEKKGSEAPEISVEHIDPFNARGMCRVYGRRDIYQDLAVEMDVWRTRDGRLFVRFSACYKDGHQCSFEVTGFSGPKGPKGQPIAGGDERWVPKRVRDKYDDWIERPWICLVCGRHERECDCFEFGLPDECSYCGRALIPPYSELGNTDVLHCGSCKGSYFQCYVCSNWFPAENFEDCKIQWCKDCVADRDAE